MITIGRHTFKPWLRGLGAAPRTPACLCLVRLHHTNRPPEVLTVMAVKDLRAGLADFAARGGLSRAITQHRTIGSGVQVAAVECADLAEARRVAADLLSRRKKSASAPDAPEPDLAELLEGVRSLHAMMDSQERRAYPAPGGWSA